MYKQITKEKLRSVIDKNWTFCKCQRTGELLAEEIWRQMDTLGSNLFKHVPEEKIIRRNNAQANIKRRIRESCPQST